MSNEDTKPFDARKELRAMTEQTQRDVATAMGVPNLLAEVAEMKSRLPALAAYYEYMALRYLAKYKAMKAAGFDDKQALFLCCQADA